MQMIKITPNEMVRIQSVLEKASEGRDIAVKFKFAKIIKTLEEALDIFKKTMTPPNMTDYETAVRTVYSDDMKGKPEEKLKLLETIRKKYARELKALDEFNKEYADAANVALEVEITQIPVEILPDNISAGELSVLLPLLKEEA